MEDSERPKHPGQLLRTLLEQKGWDQHELAMITGWSRQSINNIILGRSGITPDLAIALGAAIGNPAEDWLRWGAQYELALAQVDKSAVERMARCFRVAPIREMRRRGWVSETKDAATLEKELEGFFGQPIDGPIAFPVATRRSGHDALSSLSLEDKAWCFRARQLARVLQVEEFSAKSLDAAEKHIRKLAAFPKEARKLAPLLATYGVRFVVVELMQGASMDGAAFWLDEESPVIAVSLRYDRIDSFWFTFMHEWFHIRNNDSLSLDSNLLIANAGSFSVAEATSESERIANESAADFLVPRAELESFARRLAPIFSKDRLVQFANRMRMHPGIVVGQLQHIGALGYSAHRDFLVKIRDAVKDAALTDGFGDSIGPDVLSGGTNV